MVKLSWVKDEQSEYLYRAESFEYRYSMIHPRKGRVYLQVTHRDQHDARGKPIDERYCASRRHAERMAQRFEDSRGKARRLR
jgi:hypothetical protein